MLSYRATDVATAEITARVAQQRGEDEDVESPEAVFSVKLVPGEPMGIRWDAAPAIELFNGTELPPINIRLVDKWCVDVMLAAGGLIVVAVCMILIMVSAI